MNVTEDVVSSQPLQSSPEWEMYHRWTPGQEGHLRVDLNIFRQDKSPPREPRVWLYTYTSDQKEEHSLEAQLSNFAQRLVRPEAQPRYLNHYENLKEASQLNKKMREQCRQLGQSRDESKKVGNKDELERLARSGGERNNFSCAGGGADNPHRPRQKSRHMDWYEKIKERNRQLEECANKARLSEAKMAPEQKTGTIRVRGKVRHSPKARHMEVYRQIRHKNAHAQQKESERRLRPQLEGSAIWDEFENILHWMNRE